MVLRCGRWSSAGGSGSLVLTRTLTCKRKAESTRVFEDRFCVRAQLLFAFRVLYRGVSLLAGVCFVDNWLSARSGSRACPVREAVVEYPVCWPLPGSKIKEGIMCFYIEAQIAFDIATALHQALRSHGPKFAKEGIGTCRCELAV